VLVIFTPAVLMLVPMSLWLCFFSFLLLRHCSRCHSHQLREPFSIIEQFGWNHESGLRARIRRQLREFGPNSGARICGLEKQLVIADQTNHAIVAIHSVFPEHFARFDDASALYLIEYVRDGSRRSCHCVCSSFDAPCRRKLYRRDELRFFDGILVRPPLVHHTIIVWMSAVSPKPSAARVAVSVVRLALANLRYPATPEAAITDAVAAVHEAAQRGAMLIVFPECYVPGYRWPTREVPPPDAAYLEKAWTTIADAARAARMMVVLGTERITADGVVLTALVIDVDGERVGWQDKVQLDPSEQHDYVAANERRLFEVQGVPFGIVICHEGFRYPETVRWAAKRGAKLVVHPHYGEAEPGSFRPEFYADPNNSFHEAAVRCRAAENTIWFATVNCASDGSPTTSAVAAPDGTIVAWQPYGEEGLLVVDCDMTPATGLLASRCRTVP